MDFLTTLVPNFDLRVIIQVLLSITMVFLKIDLKKIVLLKGQIITGAKAKAEAKTKRCSAKQVVSSSFLNHNVWR